MSQQQQSSSSFHSNSDILGMDEIFINLLPDELEDSLLTGDNLEEGNQPPKLVSKAAEPQGINNEATNVFNMEQDTNIELSDSDSDSEREVTEEEEKTVKARIKVLAERVEELEKVILKKQDANIELIELTLDALTERIEELEKVVRKKNANPDSLKVRLRVKSSGETKFFYLNYVQDGRILNAVKFKKQAKNYIVISPGAKCGYHKCVCPYCQEHAIEIFGRSNTLLEHMRRTQNIKIQCVYCDELFQSHQRAVHHIREYHWKSGGYIVLIKKI